MFSFYTCVSVCLVKYLCLLKCSSFVLPCCSSGLLTGKFKRGELPSDSRSSRLAWVEEDRGSRTNQSHPSLSDYMDNSQYWELIEAMKTIATVHGEREREGWGREGHGERGRVSVERAIWVEVGTNQARARMSLFQADVHSVTRRNLISPDTLALSLCVCVCVCVFFQMRLSLRLP